MYKSDLPLLYPPFMLALAAIFIMSGINSEQVNASKTDIKSFFMQLNMDMQDIVLITQDLLSLYHVWNDYSDDQIPSILAKFKQTTINNH